jgi:hypothetical protein
MTLQTANPELMRYFQQQQTAPGWFDLLTIMVDGMVSNAGEQESRPFLQQMGAVMAAQYPLSAPQTLGELEGQINARLAQFHWGCVDIVADDSGLNLRHQALPACDDAARQSLWCNAFCAILEGLYARWLQEQGGQAHVVVQRERLYSVTDVQFRYHNPQ